MSLLKYAFLVRQLRNSANTEKKKIKGKKTGNYFHLELI